MKESRIAIRYAKALFELSLEQNSLEQTFNDMKLVREVCLTSRDLRLMLSSPIITSDKKQNILKSVFEGKLGKLSVLYLNIITAKKREMFIEPIAEQFLLLYKEYKGIIPVILTTAAKADDEIRNKITGLLKNFTKKEVELTEEIKSEIIGGFILKFGKYQYDDSVRKKIMKLKREFNINIYEKGY
jgi:F-type H+-transporting ATPase subunit delta